MLAVRLWLSDQLCLAPLDGRDSFFDACKKRQVEVRRELDEYIIESLGSLHITDDNWLAMTLLRASENTTVITTNYDNLAERILS